MGMEAICGCRWPGGEGQVKALLETAELILRRDLRRTVPIADMGEVRVVDDELRFVAGGEALALALGAETAARWLKKIMTPPPTLAHKLGFGPQTRPYILGQSEDGILEGAITDVRADTAAEARLMVAIVDDPAALEDALTQLQDLPERSPVWIIHRKGRHVAFGEMAVRKFMRERQFMDVKVSAVSAVYTAVNYIMPTR